MTELNDERDVETAEAALCTMLREILDLLVVYPERCSVHTVRRGDSTTFQIQAEPEDLDRLIGGTSHTARSLEVLVGAVGMKSHRRFSVTFRANDEDGGIDGTECPVISRPER